MLQIMILQAALGLHFPVSWYRLLLSLPRFSCTQQRPAAFQSFSPNGSMPWWHLLCSVQKRSVVGCLPVGTLPYLMSFPFLSVGTLHTSHAFPMFACRHLSVSHVFPIFACRHIPVFPIFACRHIPMSHVFPILAILCFRHIPVSHVFPIFAWRHIPVSHAFPVSFELVPPLSITLSVPAQYSELFP